MSKKSDNKLLDEYLQGNSDLSKNYRKASTTQSPQHLDDAILAESRKAVKSKPRLAYSPFSSNWGVPVSLAAVLVLSVGLVISIYDETGQTLLHDKQPVEFSDSSTDRPALSEQSREDNGIEAKQMGRIMRGEAVMSNEALLQEEQDVVPAMEVLDAMSEEEALPAAGAYAPKPSDIKMIWQSGKGDSEPKRQRRETEERNKQSMKKEKTRTEAAAEIMRPRATADSIMEDKMMMKESVDAPAAVITPEQIMMQRKAFSKSLESLKGNEAGTLSAEEWLQHIKQLWQTGKQDEAKQQLQQFLKVYPDFNQDELGIMLPRELTEHL